MKDHHRITEIKLIHSTTSRIFCFPDGVANSILQQNILRFTHAAATAISDFTLYNHNAIICLVDSKQYGATGNSFKRALRQRGAFSLDVKHRYHPPENQSGICTRVIFPHVPAPLLLPCIAVVCNRVYWPPVDRQPGVY